MDTKATLYLDSNLYKTFKLHAVELGKSVSFLINKAMQAQLNEDLKDIHSMRSRLANSGKPISYEEALKQLKNDKLI